MSSALFYYDPFTEFDRLFDEAFNARFRRSGQPSSSTAVQRQNGNDDNTVISYRPRMDLYEDTKANTVTATFELPGLTKENVEIDVRDGRMNITGSSKISSEHEESGYAVRERRFGKFARTLQLPQGVREDQIKASMENGILKVTFPKTAPEMAPKKISIA